MVTRIHILLTYNCSLRCNHCYVFSDQRAPGKISLSQISFLLNESQKLPSVNWIIFGGGEPFTQYPMLLKAIHRARKKGFNVGVSTNGYFARTVEAGTRFLKPLAQMGVKDIRISNDYLHYKNPRNSPAKRALKAAKGLGLATTLVQVKLPGEENSNGNGVDLATNIDKRRLMFTGRAAEMITAKIPQSSWRQFNSCPREDLHDPQEVFVDAYGYVQICPGIAIGNIWNSALHTIIRDFDPSKHTILESMLSEGPAGLIRAKKLQPNQDYIEPCHCCYSIRRELVDVYQDVLAPRHVYGL